MTPLGGAAVGVTPRLCFCLPLEQRMPFSELLSHLQTRAAQQLPVAPALCTDATDGLAAAKHDAGEARAVNGSKRTDDAYLRGSDGGVAADRMRESRNGSHRCHGSGMAKAGAVRTGGSGEVWYVQQQNNSLMTEFAQLLPDVEPHLPWATGADARPNPVQDLAVNSPPCKQLLSAAPSTCWVVCEPYIRSLS